LSFRAHRAGGGSRTNLELSVNDLDDDVLVGEPDHESVLGSVVLVLGLRHETLPSVVCEESVGEKETKVSPHDFPDKLTREQR